MRLNDKTYPAISDLESGELSRLQFDGAFTRSDSPLSFETLGRLSASASEIYKQVANRYYLTQPFRQAIIKAAPKITEGFKYLSNKTADAGILFTESGFTLYLHSPNDSDLRLALFGFNREGMTSFCVMKNDDNCSLTGRYFEVVNGKLVNNNDKLMGWGHSILVTLYFIHNCEIETKVVEPKQKHRDNGVKFMNESKTPFTVLNCNWFTELIRNTPFTVNGFFRWQRCGENFSKQKLIWVESFEKKGYTRKAKKQSTDNN